MKLHHERINDISIITLEGDVYYSNNKELENKIDDELSDDMKKFLFDIRELEYIDSSSLGIMIKILKHNGQVKLILDEKNKQIKEVMELIILHFENTGFFTDKEKAIKSMT